jgi:hypothetical protein
MLEGMVANLLGLDNQIFIQTLGTLLTYGVAKRRESDNAIYCKRMVADEKLCKIRREAGKKGGNPVLLNQNQTTKDNQNPTPSSSSSSSLKTTPIPPEGAKSDRKRSAIALKTFLDECKAKGEMPIPDNAAAIVYAGSVGIPADFLWLQWREFLDRYKLPDAKRYKDWRTVFLKSVRGNWFKLWYVKDDQYVLSTVGLQAQKLHGDKAA